MPRRHRAVWALPSDLLRHIPKATRRVLNAQLNELERYGIISKQNQQADLSTTAPKVEYNLTDFGRTLLPIIEAMSHWGTAHRTRLEHLLLAKATATTASAG